MGSTRATKQELADKIALAVKMHRYELANKAEVAAYVDLKLEKLAGAIEEEIEDVRTSTDEADSARGEQIRKLEERISELELTKWQRIKRVFRRRFASREDPSTIADLGDEVIEERVRAMFPTEQAEDLEEHPEAIAAAKAAGAIPEPPLHRLEFPPPEPPLSIEIPELQGLPELSDEELPYLNDDGVYLGHHPLGDPEE